jgi:Domain of unknown function (DUF4157)
LLPRSMAEHTPTRAAPARTGGQGAAAARHERRPVDGLVAAILDLQRAAGNQAVSRLLVPEPLPAGGGAPLLTDARADLEARFGYDLGAVRVHAGSQAAAAMRAKALTSGRDIWLGPGRGPSDRTLLAHEVAHILQQGTGHAGGLRGAGGDPARRGSLEAQARQAAAAAPPAAPPRLRPLSPAATATPAVQFDSDKPSLEQVLRLEETVPVKGLPRAQSNYADRAFKSVWSAPVGDVYLLSPEGTPGQGKTGVEVPKAEFHLDDDPVAGPVTVHHRVYRSREVAEAVLRDMRDAAQRAGMNTNVYTYYLRGGYIFPTTLSGSTVPVLTGHLRIIRESNRADIKATIELGEALKWWYIGARFPIRIKGAEPPRMPPRVPPGAGAPGAVAAGFNFARVAEELVASTGSIASAGQRMLAAARQLSAMRNLTAAQKAQVMLEFFRRIGFAINQEGVVDEGLYLIMKSENAQRAFRFVKSSGEILYGRFNQQTLEYVWEALR